MITLLLLTTSVVPQVEPESRPQVAVAHAVVPTALRGAWHDTGEGELELRVESDRVALWRNGELWLFPLEDAKNVEALRKGIRLFPLKTYLDLIEQKTGSKLRR